jgi:uncharacterized protein (TIGR00297 family)
VAFTPHPSEEGRKLAHIAAGSAALLLRYTTWWQAALLLGLALAFNLYVLPRLAGGRLLRAHELRRALHTGIVLYPLTLGLIVLALHDRLDIAAAAWGILAVGDGMATLVGRRLPLLRVPWNPEKSLGGSLALVVFGGAAGAFLAWWCRPALIPPPYLWFSLGAPLVAAAAAAAVETLPIRLNDNVTVPVTAAGVLWWMSLFSEDMIVIQTAVAVGALPLALGLNAMAATAGYVGRAVTPGGAATGAFVGTIIFLTTGWAGWLLLVMTLAVAVAASRFGILRKQLLGIAEDRGGRRAVGNAIANTAVATGAAVLAAISYLQQPALVAFVAALAAAGSDTVASEIGKARAGRTWLVTTFQRARPGTPGGVSLEGTAAGLAAALLLALMAAATGLMPRSAIVAVAAAATIAAFAESALAALFEHRRIFNNDVLNFLNSLTAAAAAVWLLD